MAVIVNEIPMLILYLRRHQLYYCNNKCFVCSPSFKAFETRHCGKAENKIRLLKDLSGRKVKGEGRNGVEKIREEGAKWGKK